MIVNLHPGMEFERDGKRYIVGERYPNGKRKTYRLEYWVMELGTNARKGIISNGAFHRLQETGECQVTKQK